ncbi:GDP-mannose 4,6-dehydratase [Paraburkholderia sp. BL18I3N2]|uniref:GDP-mannose 4,6-dehydratase n=1 Tax=Paraburkholderia sp. BL18I3N2 TaxID=1938799 RepID=UPI001C6351A7
MAKTWSWSITSSTSNRESLKRVEQITVKRVTFYETDSRDRAALQRIFDAHPVSGAIHFAALKAVGESSRSRSSITTTTVLTTLRRVSPIRPLRKSCLAGARSTASSACASTIGAGNRPTRPATHKARSDSGRLAPSDTTSRGKTNLCVALSAR